MRDFSNVVALVALMGGLTACNDGTVRFGEPGGLRIRGGSQRCEVTFSPAPTPAECAATGWDGTNGIFAKYMNAGTPGNCAAGGCHAGPDQNVQVNMTPNDAPASYDALASFTDGADGAPYVSADSNDYPYMLCNINPKAEITIGSVMPKQLAPYTEAALTEITLWAACGMPKGSAMGGGGPGGMGGMGGIGGAGGAGGAGGGI